MSFRSVILRNTRNANYISDTCFTLRMLATGAKLRHINNSLCCRIDVIMPSWHSAQLFARTETLFIVAFHHNNWFRNRSFTIRGNGVFYRPNNLRVQRVRIIHMLVLALCSRNKVILNVCIYYFSLQAKKGLGLQNFLNHSYSFIQYNYLTS